MKKHIGKICIYLLCVISLFLSFFTYQKLFSAQDEIKELKKLEKWKNEIVMPNLITQEAMIYLLSNNAGVAPQDLRNAAINTINQSQKAQ